MSRVAIIGYTLKAVEGYAAFLPEVVAPSNYKDPLKIMEYVNAQRQKNAEMAEVLPLTTLIRDAKLTVHTAEGLEKTVLFNDPLTFLDALYDAQKWTKMEDEPPLVVVHKPSVFLRAALNCAADANYLKAAGSLSLLMSEPSSAFIDPYALFGSSAEPHLVLQRHNILRNYSISLPAKPTAESEWECTRALAKFGGLID